VGNTGGDDYGWASSGGAATGTRLWESGVADGTAANDWEKGGNESGDTAETVDNGDW
jgi:hypothetical protein